MGQGSLECARDMITNPEDQPGPYGPNPNTQPEWCVCGLCSMVPLVLKISVVENENVLLLTQYLH